MNPTSNHVFEEEYRATAPAVFAWLNLHLRPELRSRVDPEDLLQEIACRAFERFSSFDTSKGTFRNWMFGIARNVLMRALEPLARGNSPARAALLTTGGIARLADSATSITRAVARDESLHSLIVHLDGLTEEERLLVVYRGIEGLSHDEVAELLRLSPDAVAKRWQRLRDRIRETARFADILAA